MGVVLDSFVFGVGIKGGNVVVRFIEFKVLVCFGGSKGWGFIVKGEVLVGKIKEVCIGVNVFFFLWFFDCFLFCGNWRIDIVFR